MERIVSAWLHWEWSATDPTVWLSHRLKVLRLTYESFFNRATQEQCNEMPIVMPGSNICTNMSAFVNIYRLIFLFFLLSQYCSRDHGSGRDKWNDEKCTRSSDEERDYEKCANMANTRYMSNVRIALRRPFKWSAMEMQKKRKNDWSIPRRARSSQGHRAFIWWPTVSSVVRSSLILTKPSEIHRRLVMKFLLPGITRHILGLEMPKSWPHKECVSSWFVMSTRRKICLIKAYVA